MKAQAALAVAAALMAIGASATAADATGGVRLGKVFYDSPGADTGSNKSLNAEWFTVTNHGTTSKNLSGWAVRDPQQHIYRFPAGYHLGAGQTVKVHTGKGSSAALNRYWGEDSYVWNNFGDKAILKNGSGSVVDTCTWSGAGSGYTAC